MEIQNADAMGFFPSASDAAEFYLEMSDEVWAELVAEILADDIDEERV